MARLRVRFSRQRRTGPQNPVKDCPAYWPAAGRSIADALQIHDRPVAALLRKVLPRPIRYWSISVTVFDIRPSTVIVTLAFPAPFNSGGNSMFTWSRPGNATPPEAPE